MMPVPTMTQTFVPGGLTGRQPSKQVPVPQQMPAAHRNAPMPIAMTAGALMPEALRSVLAPPPTPTPVAINVQALAAMPQLLQPQLAEVPLDVLQMMAAASPDQQQAFIETLLARQQRQMAQAEPGKAMSSAGTDQAEPRRLFQWVEGEPDWTEPAVRMPRVGMPQTFGPPSTDESRQMQVDMDHHFAATLQQEEDGRPVTTEKEAANAAASSGKNRGNQ